MAETPVDFDAALKFYQRQSVDPTQAWTNLCQMIFRLSWGVPALYGSAWAQFLAADHKVVSTDFDKAPFGAGLCTKGPNPAGHIYEAARPFPSGKSAAWSNDLVHTGKINKVVRDAPVFVWNHVKKGWVLEVNEYELDLTHGAPPKPKQNKRYQSIDVAIHKMERALETARRDKDHHDIKLFRQEIRDLKKLYAEERHA